MKILTTEQGTEAWFKARSGHFTASEIDAALSSPGTVKRRDLIMQMVWDLEGVERFQDDPPWFEAGRRFEDRGRAWYSFTFDADVEEVGFIEADPPFTFLGASPDGLVGSDGCIEIKHRATLRSYKRAVEVDTSSRKSVRNLPRQYMSQVQAVMFCAARRWCDFVDFWCDEEHDVRQGNVRRIERDDGYIERLIMAASNCYREAVEIYNQRKEQA